VPNLAARNPSGWRGACRRTTRARREGLCGKSMLGDAPGFTCAYSFYFSSLRFLLSCFFACLPFSSTILPALDLFKEAVFKHVQLSCFLIYGIAQRAG
jgi:hypothetical protein